MLTPDTTPIFPACPTYGFSAEPQLLVKAVTREGGYETLDRKWSQPLLIFDGAPMGPRPQRDIERVLHFWRAIGGSSTRFRFKDWMDYKSCFLDDDAAPIDQPIQAISGSPGGFQLSKVYWEDSDNQTGLSSVRPITRPKGNTIRIANTSGVEQASSTWTLDESTGYVTPLGGFSGTPGFWGGEFYVWVRFTSFRPEISNHKIQNLICSLKECRRSDV